jgi:hypothetical protein
MCTLRRRLFIVQLNHCTKDKISKILAWKLAKISRTIAELARKLPEITQKGENRRKLTEWKANRIVYFLWFYVLSVVNLIWTENGGKICVVYKDKSLAIPTDANIHVPWFMYPSWGHIHRRQGSDLYLEISPKATFFRNFHLVSDKYTWWNIWLKTAHRCVTIMI